MTTYELLLRNVIENPEDDAARRAFAAHVQPSDPDLATFIEDQLEVAAQRRTRQGSVGRYRPPLLERHEAAWTRTLSKYVRGCTFDRGFVTRIEIDPEMFLEYGDYLFVLAPIRDVVFVPPEEGDFPMAAIAASPLIERLDAVSFDVPSLTERDLELFAASPYLSRLLVLSSVRLDVGTRVYDAFAATPSGRKMLFLKFSGESFPGQEFGDTGKDDWWGAAILDWLPMKPAGIALEQRYGYIPWLHGDNFCESFDAAYYVAKGILPVKPPGAPV